MNKFLSFILCIFMLLGAVACTPNQQPEKNYDDQHKEQQEEAQEEQKTLYDDIISQYTVLLTAKHNGEELSAPDPMNMDTREFEIAEALYGVVDACSSAEAAEKYGYGFKDLDANGIPELIILHKYAAVMAIFTISENLPILLEANYGTGRSIKFATENRFLFSRSTVSEQIEEVTFYTCHVEGDKMVYDSIHGKVYDQSKNETLDMFQISDGNRVSIEKETFRALNWMHTRSSQPSYNFVSKLEAPRIHFPLVEDVTAPNLPVADFSDYVAIRRTYLAISACIEEFNATDWWIEGKYDNLFSFTNDASFEYYNRLLYIAYHSDNHMGYDEIDLNGDGQDELVLMTEDYRIKAIFTQKDGVPVLLDAFEYPYHTCWLDADGFIHADRESYDELEYSLYEFSKSGEYKLLYSVLATNYGRYLMNKDRKTELISFEESMEIRYDDYVRYSEPFDPNEHTRNVSELTYTPLTEITEDLMMLATDKTWHKYAKLEKTTGKDFARSNTYVTFENVTDAQADMNLKYVFSFSYPDPNRDHYLLDDTTEATLSFTVRNENGTFVFDENGMQGRLEFGQDYLWIIIEESSDERFPVGNYCYGQKSSQSILQ